MAAYNQQEASLVKCDSQHNMDGFSLKGYMEDQVGHSLQSLSSPQYAIIYGSEMQNMLDFVLGDQHSAKRSLLFPCLIYLL